MAEVSNLSACQFIFFTDLLIDYHYSLSYDPKTFHSVACWASFSDFVMTEKLSKAFTLEIGLCFGESC